MIPVLREYQREAVRAAESAWAAGTRRALVVAATGSGKTTSISQVVKNHIANGGMRVLVVAHRRELLDQLADRLALFGVIVIRGLEIDATGVAHVASVQSVARRLDRLPSDTFDLIVADECHHSVAPGQLAALSHFPNARILGVTATPDRADGASLGLAFDACVSRYDIAEAVADGHLVPARGVRVEVAGLDLSMVRVRPIAAESSSGGAWRDIEDLHPGDLGRAVIAPEAVEGVVGPLLELAGERRTVVFAVDLRHARAIAASICERRPGAARVVCGADRMSARRQTLLEHRAGVFQFLVNVQLICEGYDDPDISCVALARPTRSRTIVSQTCGRGLRPAPLKNDCLILDFTTSTSQFSLVCPEDVLAGCMIGPSSEYRAKRRNLLAVSPYVPVRWVGQFMTAIVDLMRRAGSAVAETVRRVSPAPVRRAGSKVGRVLAALLVG